MDETQKCNVWICQEIVFQSLFEHYIDPSIDFLKVKAEAIQWYLDQNQIDLSWAHIFQRLGSMAEI